MISAMEYATVSVSSLERALALFEGVMELKVEQRYEADRALLELWELPQVERGRIVELSCRGYPWGRLRLIELAPTPAGHVRLDHRGADGDSASDVGPKALDFYVRAPIDAAVEKLARAGFAPRSAPVRHQIGETVSEELLFSGPDGVPILLMVGHRHRPTSLREGSPHGPFSEIPTVSIVCGNLDASRRFYGDLLGLTAVNDAETPDAYRDLVDDLTGVPRGTRVHFLLYARAGEPSGKILLVHFFERTGKRLTGRMHPGRLGFALLGHRVEAGLDALAARLARAGYPPLAAPREVTRGARCERVMLVRGPNEELFELTEPVA